MQADLKTFAAVGVHGACVVTAITAQNTREVRTILEISPKVVKDQIRAILGDLKAGAVKIGMLYSEGAIRVVAQELEGRDFPIVVDPILVSKCGVPLLKPIAIPLFKDLIVPLGTVITPNIHEAEALTGISVKGVEEATEAAEFLAEMGAKSVVVKGGHLPSPEEIITDVFYVDGKVELLKHERIETKTTHGTGCCFSSAIAAELAKGAGIADAVKTAEEFITKAIRFGLPIGRGYGPANPVAGVRRDAERYRVLSNVREAVEILESHPEVADLVPEIQMNVAMAIPEPSTIEDVVAIPGRIVRVGKRVKASSCPAFGGSRHVASAILAVMEFDPTMRAAMDIRFSEPILRCCRGLGFKIAHYNRKREPEPIRAVEGASTPWAVRRAIVKCGKLVPDVIHLTEALGKEAVILVLGKDAVDVAKMAVRIAEELGKVS